MNVELTPEMLNTIISGLQSVSAEMKWGEGYSSNEAAARGYREAEKIDEAIVHLRKYK